MGIGRATWTRAAAAVLLVLALPGCGSGPGDGGAKVSWRRAADGICERTERSIRAIAAPEDVPSLGPATSQAAAEVRAAAREIRGLEVADAERARVQPFLGSLSEIEHRLGELSTAVASRRNVDVLREARELQRVAIELAPRAERAGLTVCGRSDTGLAAAVAVALPAYAAEVAKTHLHFFTDANDAALRHDPLGTAAERGRFWIAVDASYDRLAHGPAFDGGLVPVGYEQPIGDYLEAWSRAAALAGRMRVMATGSAPAGERARTERAARQWMSRSVHVGEALLGVLGPAGESQLGRLRGVLDVTGRRTP